MNPFLKTHLHHQIAMPIAKKVNLKALKSKNKNLKLIRKLSIKPNKVIMNSERLFNQMVYCPRRQVYNRVILITMTDRLCMITNSNRQGRTRVLYHLILRYETKTQSIRTQNLLNFKIINSLLKNLFHQSSEL
jgi:hypothetical protein